MPASLLSCIERAKSAFGDQNVKLKKLAFLRLHLSNATSEVRVSSQRHETCVSTTKRGT